MNNSFRKNDDDNDELSLKYNTPREIERTKSHKIRSKFYSPKKYFKKSSFIPDRFSLVKDDKNTNKENMRKSSMPDDIKKVDTKKSEKRNNLLQERGKKKDGVNKKNLRKSQKKPESPNKKKDNALVNKIKVVGRVSVKLNQLIQRLSQFQAPIPNDISNQTENKYVMAPRIKAALEKFNKKNEDKPEIMHFGGGKVHRRYNEEESNKEELSSITSSQSSNEDEESEYEEDESYEEGDEEEEEENEQEEVQKENEAKGKKRKSIAKRYDKKIKEKNEKKEINERF